MIDARRYRIELSDTTRVVVSTDQLSCDLGGEAALVNLKNGVYYGLDPVGAQIWNLMREPITLADIRDAVIREYDVDRESADADIRQFLSDLAEQGLIDITS